MTEITLPSKTTYAEYLEKVNNILKQDHFSFSFLVKMVSAVSWTSQTVQFVHGPLRDQSHYISDLVTQTHANVYCWDRTKDNFRCSHFIG